jgi:hypothetical protein
MDPRRPLFGKTTPDNNPSLDTLAGQLVEVNLPYLVAMDTSEVAMVDLMLTCEDNVFDGLI